MLPKYLLAFILCCISYYGNGVRAQPNNPNNLTATQRVLEVFKKYDGTLENPKLNNSHPVITQINQSFGIWSRSHYCGTSLYYICKEAGLSLPIPRSQALRAVNWRKYGTIVWDPVHGWKSGVSRTPLPSQLFILVFNWNGQNHVGVALAFHGGLKFITGEGNTSEAGVRKPEFAFTDFAPLTPPKTAFIPQANVEGIWMRKERYNTRALVAVVAYDVI